MDPIVSVDLGGTNLRVAYFSSPQPPPDALNKTPTLASEGPQAVIGRMIEAIESVLPPDSGRLRIGVGAPGPLDPFQGVVLETPNLPGWTGVPLSEMLSRHFGCPVSLANDANLAALGESRFGAGRGARNLIYLTISTGIGGGVIAEGRMLQGAQGLASELGHMTVVPDGPRCGCGQSGHLEALAAGPAIARRAVEALAGGATSSLAGILARKGELTSREVGEAALAGDRLAREVIAETGTTIGRHLASLVHAFNPEVIILGGGVATLGELLFEPLEEALRAHAMHPRFVQELRVLPAQLGDQAGLIGAMVMASERPSG